MKAEDVSDLLTPGCGSVYVTIATPVLDNTDKMGFLPGMAKNMAEMTLNILKVCIEYHLIALILMYLLVSDVKA